MQIIKILLILTLLPSSSFAKKINSYDVLGLWLSEDKDGIIRLTRDGESIVGHLVWILPPKGEKVSEILDKENPDEKLKSKQLLGIKLLKNFKFDDEKWSGGSIYDPKSGKTYSAYMSLKNNETLKLRGFVGISLFGRTSVWTRVSKLPN